MKQTNRFLRLVLFFAGIILLAGCTAKDTDLEPSEAVSVPTLSVEAPSPSVSAAPSPSPETTPDTEPVATPTPGLTVAVYEEENGRIRLAVESYDSQTACICYKTYLDGALVSVLEYTQGRAFGQKDDANITKRISYLDGKERSRFEERAIYSSEGNLLEYLEISGGLYLSRADEYVYTDGLQTEYLRYGGNYELLQKEVMEYDEKGQMLHAKYTNERDNYVLAEVFWEYYENGNVKLERRTEPEPYIHTYYENGKRHIQKGYTEAGNWYHYEYDEEGNRYEYDEEGNLIATVLHEPDEKGEE